MDENVDLFLSLAEIGGIFVAFGALIGIVRGTRADRFLVRGVVHAGLLVIAAALIPIGLSLYPLEPTTTWRLSSVAFLVLIWATTLSPLRDRAAREDLREQVAARRTIIVALAILGIAIQVPLFFTFVGLFPVYASALYSTALILNLLHAALLLSQLVFSQDAPGD